MYALRRREQDTATKSVEKESSFSGKEREMPNLIFAAAAASFSKSSRPHTAGARTEHTKLTRSRVATRRLRASNPHEAHFDLGPLDLTRRH